MAGEMEREGFELPLLIGGATTSRTHTAVKIEPQYHGPVIHVADASRAVGVAARPARRGPSGPGSRAGSARSTRPSAASAGRAQEQIARHPVAEARRQRLAIDWAAVTPPRPTFLGVRTFDEHPLAELVDRIDWTPFFATWELNGLLPRRSSTTRWSATAARTLHADARRCSSASSRAPAARRGPSSASGRPTPSATTSSSTPTTPRTPSARPTIHTLRQQMVKPPGRPNLALADFIAPRDDRRAPTTSAAFAVTAGHGLEALVAEAKAAHDDYTRDPRERARGPAGRGVRRAAARARPPRAVGLRPGRGARRTTTSSPSATRASGPRPAIPPAPTTPRRDRSSSCSTPRRAPASC